MFDDNKWERRWRERTVAEIPALENSINRVIQALNALNLVDYQQDRTDGNDLEKAVRILGKFQASMQLQLNHAYREKEKLDDQPTVGQ